MEYVYFERFYHVFSLGNVHLLGKDGTFLAFDPGVEIAVKLPGEPVPQRRYAGLGVSGRDSRGQRETRTEGARAVRPHLGIAAGAHGRCAPLAYVWCVVPLTGGPG